MISDASTEGISLLDDLMSYVYSGDNCKLILIGDTAQLPPVHLALSPALNEDALSLQYRKEVRHIELDEVMRQEEKSVIFYNATQTRDLLKDNYITVSQFDLSEFKDIVWLTDANDIQDAIIDSYVRNGMEDSSFIVRSNK